MLCHRWLKKLYDGIALIIKPELNGMIDETLLDHDKLIYALILRLSFSFNPGITLRGTISAKTEC